MIGFADQPDDRVEYVHHLDDNHHSFVIYLDGQEVQRSRRYGNIDECTHAGLKAFEIARQRTGKLIKR